MARPPTLQKLRHGRILSGRVFRLFVETWNWIVGYVDNLKGDGDVNPQSGCVFVDRTNPDAPVIRLRIDRLPKGGSPGDPVAVSADGPFSPVYDVEGDDPDVVIGFRNCYWQNGGVTVLMSDQSIPGSDGFITLKAGASPSTNGTATLYCYASLAALQAAQRDRNYFVVPLYRMTDSKITLDMRRMPVVYMYEML